MGVLNLTPDSFSDGGRYADDDEAIAQAETMARHGADIIDIGGESTRPGAARVDATEQLRRIESVLGALRVRLPGLLLSVDTTLPRVAERALDLGAGMLNDIAAGAEAGMFALAAERRVPIVLMHMRGAPSTMQAAPAYRDVVGEVRAYLLARAELAERAGVAREHIVLDPGIGFGKTVAHNLALLTGLPELVATGYPILLGASRKSTLRTVCGAHQDPALVGATCATTALAFTHGVRIVRVHDVLPNRQAADVAWAIRSSREAPDEAISD
ncbi:MAG: dihydropteroate synthase [Gammaproteobacteria bacterium]|nr:dihydropteroate synthase [Gammaproteobacteria bacterium]